MAGPATLGTRWAVGYGRSRRERRQQLLWLDPRRADRGRPGGRRRHAAHLLVGGAANSAPAFAVTLIWQFTSLWNDFLFAVFLTGPTSWPTTVRLNNIADSMVVPYSQQMAAALLASIPTLVVYLLLGRFFMRGLMAGALKG